MFAIVLSAALISGGAAAVAAPVADDSPIAVRVPAATWRLEVADAGPRHEAREAFDTRGFVRAVDAWMNVSVDQSAPIAAGAPREHLIVVPLPPAATAGLAMLGGLAGAAYLRRRRIEQPV